MIRVIYVILFLCLLLVIGCASTSGGLKNLEEPKEDSVLILGDVLVENIDEDFSFKNWDYSFKVVVVGKSNDGTMNHYTVTTDARGYYCIPNVPAGQYALKAIILFVVGGMPIKLVNDLTDYNSKFYCMRHPEQPIEYTAQWLPAKVDGRIINFNIRWFGLRSAEVADMDVKARGKILLQKFSKSIQNKRFYDQGYIYSRQEPLTHFESKFPNSGWWNLSKRR